MAKRALADIPANSRPQKRQKSKHGLKVDQTHPALRPYYENVTTLRQYILARFTQASQARKKRLQQIPLWTTPSGKTNSEDGFSSIASASSHGTTASDFARNDLARLLDTTIVGYTGRTSDQAQHKLAPQSHQSIQQLSQKLRSTLKDGPSQGNVSQADIIDFAVGHLYNTVYRASRFPPSHVLCNGFSKMPGPESSGLWTNGLYCTFSNCNAVVMQSGAWPALLKVLGKDGDHVMLDLIFHCAVFVPLEAGKNNLCQISGIQICEIPLLKQAMPIADPKLIPAPLPKPANKPILNKLTEIKIVRNRMFYARPGLNAKGAVRLGLQHIHVFNRYADASNPDHVTHVMKYIFPRQFGLHNVFTCKPDYRETTQAQKDYTMREQEIDIAARKKHFRSPGVELGQKLPRRLRGTTLKVITKLLRRHANCAYVELLRHYCSIEDLEGRANDSAHDPDSMDIDDSEEPAIAISRPTRNIVDLAIPHRHVYGFCRAVLLWILPSELFDASGTGNPNSELILKHIEDFILARKRESLDLHSLLQGIKLTNIPWISSPSTAQSHKIAMSDLAKRKELFSELLYYIFDSILIPLIRCNFHVTESNTNMHQLFYFRHDVWRRVTEAHLSTLRLSMFEDIPSSKSKKKSSLADPCGHMRLVPKGTSFRSIMNLKRKCMTYQNGKLLMGKSVNSILEPVYSMLKHEKQRQPGKLGSSIFSVDEIYPKLKYFRESLKDNNQAHHPLYFAKVDVSNCFDTIPQDEVLDLVHDLCDQTGYATSTHAQVSARMYQGSKEPTISKKFRYREPARSLQDTRSFNDYIDKQYGASRSNTVFVEKMAPRPIDRAKLMKLLDEHISHNKVKLGKKFLKQKRGIPQGSILSTILCNFFYGQFESECLGFTNTSDSLLLRLLDDFLIITLDRSKATKFLQIMHHGNKKYGITIKPQKSLSNFPITIDGHAVPLCTNSEFPYCGKTIHISTLSISRDRIRQDPTRILESLTIERSKNPGEAFHRLTLDALKRQLHAQFTDSTMNSSSTILTTLYQDFLWSALRMHTYIRGLRSIPVPGLIIKTIEDLATMTYSILASGSKLKQDLGYVCRTTKGEVTWLVYKAFQRVLGKRQTSYEQVVAWLDGQLDSCKPGSERVWQRLRTVAAS